MSIESERSERERVFGVWCVVIEGQFVERYWTYERACVREDELRRDGLCCCVIESEDDFIEWW